MPAIAYSRDDPAGAAIARFLKEEHGFRPSTPVDGRPAWRNEALGVPLIELEGKTWALERAPVETDCLIMASRHSGKGGPCLSSHVVGNWGEEAAYGGRPGRVGYAPALWAKQALRALAAEGGEAWPAAMESTHHGPLIDVPLVFMELGSSEKEWADEDAARRVARAIMTVVSTKLETRATHAGARIIPVIGVGGGHYCPAFTPLQKGSAWAIGHVLTKHAVDAVTEETLREAIERTVPRAERVLVDWKGLNAAQRERIATLCERVGIAHERV